MNNTLLIVFVAVALIFDFLNGIHDSSNIVATMISSRAFRPQVALGVTALAEFVGPLIFGVAVAKMVGDGIVSSAELSIEMILAALLGAIVWNLLTWLLGIPSSSSHALIGGLIGAVAFGSGVWAVKWEGVVQVFGSLFLSPLIGFGVGFVFTRLIYFLARGASPKINTVFSRSQVVTAVALALSHGANDAQKTMGVITLGLVIMGKLESFLVPNWVILSSAGAIAVGTAFGGWRLIKTLGGKFYKIRPVHSFSSQISSASVIIGASLLGGPVSTTQVVSSAIMGVGASERWGKVRWRVAKDILVAWLITIPSTALISGLIYWALETSDIISKIK
jgi:PiT family inorganic phosphate transporter